MNGLWREPVDCPANTYCKEYPTSQGKTGTGCFEYNEEPAPDEPDPDPNDPNIQPPVPPPVPSKEYSINWNFIALALVGLVLLILGLKYFKKKR
jgi:hypothetical protein